MKKILALVLVLTLALSFGAVTAFAEEASEHEDYIKIEDVAVISAEEWWHNDDSFILDYTFTCLYPEKDGVEYPQYITINYAFLDENGTIIQTNSFQFSGMSYGDSARASSFPISHAKNMVFTREQLSQFSAVKFLGCEALWITGKIIPFEHYTFENQPVFDLAGLSGTALPLEKESVILSIGDSIKTDSVELTVSDCAFQDSVGIGSGISLAASGDDMILACLTFEVRNLSKEPLVVRKILDVQVDYNDGFIYSTQDKFCYLVEAEDTNPSVCTFKYNGSASGTEFSLSPLASDKFTLAIPCIDLARDDDSAPLKIVFTLPNEGGEQLFEYVIR